MSVKVDPPPLALPVTTMDLKSVGRAVKDVFLPIPYVAVLEVELRCMWYHASFGSAVKVVVVVILGSTFHLEPGAAHVPV